MSAELIVEVLRYAPADLTPAEKLLLTVIAESCNPKSRTTWYREGWDADEVARRCQVSAASLGKLFLGLARKGCEVRVPFDTDLSGRPVFARRGRQTTFRLPRFTPISPDHRPTKPPVSPDSGPTKLEVRSDGGLPRSDGGPTYGPVRSDGGPPLLLKDLSSKNTSSLSPREDDAWRPSVPTQKAEREIEEASQEDQTTNPVHRLLLEAGCPTERLTEAEQWITDECQPRGLGWWRKTAGNDDLKVHVAAFLDAGQAAPVCAVCDDTGQAGDWMNPRACDCIWSKDPAAARRQFMAHLKDFPDCDHGLAGGDVKAPNGWQHCSSCRGPGWVDPNVQPRTNDKRINTRRSTGVVRAEQALRVAADLDALSPADRRIRDAGPLYEKYKALENQKDRFTPIPVPIGQSGYDESVR